MSLTLAPPPPSFASPPSRYPVAGAAASSAATAAARPPTSRLRVSCHAACRAPPSPSIAEFEPLPRRGGRPSLYEILRVRENASAREIKAAYRALAKSHHPDAAGDSAGPDGRDFIEIHDAYETLSDPAARAVYDLSLGGSTATATGSRRRPAPGGWAGFCPTRRWETDQCW